MGLFINISKLSTHGKKDLISDDFLATAHTINLAGIGACFALCGIIANVLNIIVFIKQGLHDTVNIGLFGLAVSDLCSLITLEGVCALRNPMIIKDLPIAADEFQHLVACWPHACFARITSTITVYITLERCLCVVIPLKVKSIITPRLTTCVVVAIFLVTIGTVVPEYLSCYPGWKLLPEQNRSVIGLIMFPGTYDMSTINFNLAVGTQVASFGALVVFSVLLVVKLKEQSKWRQSASNCGSSSTKDANYKENRAVKMITLVACIYCVCFLPMLACFITVTCVPGFVSFGSYNNIYFLCWSFAFLFDSFNSSVNIFIYYKMSTKFRTTFQRVICLSQSNIFQSEMSTSEQQTTR